MNHEIFNSGPPNFETIQTIDIDCSNCHRPMRLICPPGMIDYRKHADYYRERYIEMAKRYEALLQLIPHAVAPYVTMELERQLKEKE